MVSATPGTRIERLPSGRHGLTREVVLASQRGRLLDAMARAVAEKGYAAATVADVVAIAGVSRRTFYEQFADKESCFLAAYDTGVELVLGRIRLAVDALPEADWRTRARVGIETFMNVLAEEPAFAWALVVEVIGAGRAALARHAEIMGLFAQVHRKIHDVARREDPTLPELPDVVFATLAGGLEELLREGLQSGGAESLPALTDTALEAVVAIFGSR
jgi:AcrR family transcriptional regulator